MRSLHASRLGRLNNGNYKIRVHHLPCNAAYVSVCNSPLMPYFRLDVATINARMCTMPHTTRLGRTTLLLSCSSAITCLLVRVNNTQDIRFHVNVFIKYFCSFLKLYSVLPLDIKRILSYVYLFSFRIFRELFWPASVRGGPWRHNHNNHDDDHHHNC